jgi:hypothetical protein
MHLLEKYALKGLTMQHSIFENDGLTSDETQTDSEHETWDLDGDVIAWRIRYRTASNF